MNSVGEINNVTHTSDDQYTITLFGATGGAAQSGNFSSKLSLKGGGEQTRDLQLFQDYNGYATISSSWTSNYLDITNFNRVRFNQQAYLGNNTQLWNSSGHIQNLNGQSASYYLDYNNFTNTPSGGATISNNTSSTSTHYPTLSTSATTNDSFSTAVVSDTELKFVPSTGTLSARIFTSLSDFTRKKNIQNIKNAVDLTKQINGVKFDWKENGTSSAGVIAQEVEKVLPEIVHTDDEGIKSVNYNGVVGLLVEAIKEQQQEINNLKEMIRNLS